MEEDTRVDSATEGRVIIRHYTAMLTKRVHVGRRDFKSLLCVTLVNSAGLHARIKCVGKSQSCMVYRCPSGC